MYKVGYNFFTAQLSKKLFMIIIFYYTKLILKYHFT